MHSSTLAVVSTIDCYSRHPSRPPQRFKAHHRFFLAAPSLPTTTCTAPGPRARRKHPSKRRLHFHATASPQSGHYFTVHDRARARLRRYYPPRPRCHVAAVVVGFSLTCQTDSRALNSRPSIPIPDRAPLPFPKPSRPAARPSAPTATRFRCWARATSRATSRRWRRGSCTLTSTTTRSTHRPRPRRPSPRPTARGRRSSSSRSSASTPCCRPTRSRSIPGTRSWAAAPRP